MQAQWQFFNVPANELSTWRNLQCYRNCLTGEGTTISAKPQIRNIRAEVTKLVPTALRVRRADKGSKQKKGAATTLGGSTEPSSEGGQGNMAEEPTKDDVYSQFMKEMEGFL